MPYAKSAGADICQVFHRLAHPFIKVHLKCQGYQDNTVYQQLFA